MRPSHGLTAILPCNDLDASEAFYRRLGFTRPAPDAASDGADDSYRMLADGKGGFLHLTDAVPGWLTPGRNPFGLYLYCEEVDALAARFAGEMLERTDRSTSPGACTSSRFRTPTRRSCASVARAAFGPDGSRGVAPAQPPESRL